MLCSRLLWLVLLSLLSMPLSSHGQRAAIAIAKVEFGSARSNGDDASWFEIGVEVKVTGSFESSAPSVVEMVLEVAVAAADGGDFVFMKKEVAFFLPKRGDSKTVYFYVPPAAAEGLRLQREPYGWRVMMKHNGEAVPLVADAYSRNLREREAAQSFARRVGSEAAVHTGWLQPIYLTPFYDDEDRRYEDSPSFIRTERDASR